MNEFVDVLVIGAGPSGCVSSCYLHNNGAKVKVVEKTKFPRLVVGESLIPRAMEHFHEAGLFDALDKMNFEKKPGARFIRGEEVWLWVIQFSNGNTSVGIVGPTDFIDSLSSESTSEALRKAILMSKHSKDRFGDLDFLFEPIKLQNYSRAVKKMYGDGFALTGNSTEFLDPIFSSGVAFATESGMLAAKLALREINGENVDWETEFSDYMKEGIETFRTYVEEWYTGNLQTLFFHQPENPEVKRKICSVLAGYVWDKSNPFVLKHKNIIKNMAHMLNMEKDFEV